MSITRNGKIARLPREIREQLNRKLDDGMEAGPILEWVNELPETKQVMAELFEGKPINPQNLSDWRQGGYQDWLRARERAELAGLVLEEGEEFAGTAPGANLSQRLGVAFALELAAQLRRWQRETGEPQARWRQSRELYRELAELRREDHRAQRLKIAQEKWAWEEEALEEAKELKERETQQREAEARFKRAKNALYFWGRSAEAMVGETEVVRAINGGKALPEWVQRLLAEREGREEGPESRRLNAAAAQWEAEKARDRANPVQANRTAAKEEAGMTNDECPMTKEGRSPKPDENRDEVENRQEKRKDAEREDGEGAGIGANQGESSPIKADQAEQDTQTGVQGGEGCQDPPSLGSYGAAGPPAPGIRRADEGEVQGNEDPPSPRLRRAGEDEEEGNNGARESRPIKLNQGESSQ